MTPNQSTQNLGSRADLHCHSTASEVSKLGVQRALGLPECATPPEEVYALAKARGMDFVTITDHDTIDGAVEIAEKYDDAFISEELTAGSAASRRPCTCSVTASRPTTTPACRSSRRRRGVRRVPPRARDHHALAHPFYAVEAPLLPRHAAASRSCSRSGRSATAPARPS